eukprot:1695271-Rhodomonas_salina.1
MVSTAVREQCDVKGLTKWNLALKRVAESKERHAVAVQALNTRVALHLDLDGLERERVPLPRWHVPNGRQLCALSRVGVLRRRVRPRAMPNRPRQRSPA